MKIEPGYELLADVLQAALDQAQAGKGRERHANNLPFEQQTIMQTARAHGVAFLTGQAEKKAREMHGLPTADRKVAELLGAINYLAAAVLLEREKAGRFTETKP